LLVALLRRHDLIRPQAIPYTAALSTSPRADTVALLATRDCQN
jgi:hypothetical protein